MKTVRWSASGHPAYTVKKLGVDLIWIFPFSDLDRLIGPANQWIAWNTPSGRGNNSPGTRRGHSVMENGHDRDCMMQTIV